MSRKLGKKLWELVESDQGYAFISDEVEHVDDATALMRAERALLHQTELNKKLRAFIKEAKRKADQP